ncbi:MAG TPA: DEAD/DEAH box helicase [Nitrososphaerales archaeon]|nr:DEAD/DEAH box helicase [Nitrososphaerales archaeon]
MRFEDLPLKPEILRGVEAAGYKAPFPIQERSIGPLLAGRDVIGQAKTGSGKTAAFGLPLLQFVNTADHSVQSLVLVPTRELAQQITHELERLGKFTEVRVLAVFGGQSISVQTDQLSKGVHVVVGTPGRIIDHLRRGTLNLGNARFVVLDEADRMLDMGFIDDVNFILGATPPRKQLALFSATMPEEVVRLTNRFMHGSEKILVDSDEPSVESLDQYYTVVPREGKLEALLAILSKGSAFNVIVFCRTRHGARRLARELDKRYLNAVPLHGDLTQAQRDHSMNMFRSGRMDILVATDVASRGIDIVHVDAVVNYDVPEDPLIYFHRVGRTARAGRAGKSYTLVSPQEFSDFSRILKLTKVKILPMKPEDEMFAMESAPSRFKPRRGPGHRRPRYGRRGFRRRPS